MNFAVNLCIWHLGKKKTFLICQAVWAFFTSHTKHYCLNIIENMLLKTRHRFGWFSSGVFLTSASQCKLCFCCKYKNVIFLRRMWLYLISYFFMFYLEIKNILYLFKASFHQIWREHISVKEKENNMRSNTLLINPLVRTQQIKELTS